MTAPRQYRYYDFVMAASVTVLSQTPFGHAELLTRSRTLLTPVSPL